MASSRGRHFSQWLPSILDYNALMSVLFALLLLAPIGDLTADEFQRLHRELQPGDEPWLSIPWQTSLLEARDAAAKAEKPIFIWAMDGHPLGCT